MTRFMDAACLYFKAGSAFNASQKQPTWLKDFEMRYKPLLMIVVSLLGQVAKSEEENPSSVIKNKLQVFMPERLSIQFGDPIFLPIAIVNTTDELLEGTTMIGSTPDIDFKLSTADEEKVSGTEIKQRCQES